MEKNKRCPAREKADETYLLTTKLFCGKCQRLMVGESGTSRTGKKHHYYKCGSSKRKTGCDKKAVKKDWIEALVVNRTMWMILDDSALEYIADMVMKVQAQENIFLPALKQYLTQTEQGIQNMLNAIQQSIFTSSTKQQLDELEETITLKDIEGSDLGSGAPPNAISRVFTLLIVFFEKMGERT